MSARIALACFLACGLVSRPLAQTPPPQAVPPAAAPVAAPPAQAAQVLSNAELEALVAPVALYPDTLLAQLLMASTYPLEVVQADRWVAANKKLKGDALKVAAEKQPWDASVKSLVATPSVLEMMSKNLDWTQKLGDAVLAQQPDVMDGVQRMRTRAYDAKKLSSGSQQKVTVRQESGKQTILIEPTQPDTLYVPYYDPAVAYGSWPYPAYPPYYFPAPGYIATGVLATGLAFGTAYALGRWSTGNYWGGNVNWNNNNINIDRNRVAHWEHNPQHRHGVQYRNNAVQQKFGGNNLRAGSEGRMDFRGRSGDQVLRPEGGRGDLGAGARPEQRPGDRADAANRPDRGPGDRAGAGNRPGGPGRDARPGGDGRGQGARAATQPRRPDAGARRPAPGRDSAFGNVQQGRAANLQSQRGQASLAHARGGGPRAMHAGGPGMGRGPAMNRGGGMSRGGMGGGHGGGRGGGRRSDIRLKHDVVLLGHLDNGLGLYSFAYGGSEKRYVGVIAQEVLSVAPWAVRRGADGYLRVDYRVIGVPFQSFEQWRASAAPALVPVGGAD
ncbi:MAG TPA: DUF3300 domain-containing protein [Bosea sp. (in: a-proteobacteria)]|jgi:hypothetical protein|uniref:DUF3300 domain-containing protein n=1 Tax=Bosea sp. (in: a-proteobacteria) TaxID=1871050 RepID=UPI002E164340|nr:DUF3300 domain-containing protein [Bosea sp. (in: a-proteobacteria)]